MRLLVTGGAGFIGANFVHSTVREHPEDAVTVIDALTYAGRRESLADVEDAIKLVEGDICDSELVSALVAESVTVPVTLPVVTFTSEALIPVSVCVAVTVTVAAPAWFGEPAAVPVYHWVVRAEVGSTKATL